MINRRQLMTGAAAVLATMSPALSTAQEMILRRPPEPGEDPEFVRYGQQGDFIPNGKPLIVSYDSLRVVVHYPRYTRKARLVVFSHGALADPQVYRLLIDHWVSHGFVVAAPIHDDSVFERGLLARRTSVTGSTTWEIDKVLNDSAAWDARCEACRSPLDQPERLGNTVDMEIDTERPIIIGHEFGAFVAQLLLGTVVEVENGVRRNFEDGRWFAGCMLSPQGPGIMGLAEDSWSRVTRPLMVVQGALETDFTLQSPEHKVSPFELSPAGNKHLVWFKSGDRLLYSGPRAGTSGKSGQRFEYLRAVTAAWLDAYGNYNAETFGRIAADWVDRATLGEVTTRYR